MILRPKKHFFRVIFIATLVVCAGFYSIDRAMGDMIDSGLLTAGSLLEAGKADSAAVVLFDIIEDINQNDRVRRSETLYYLAISMKQLGRLPEQINYLISARETGIDMPFADKIRHSYGEILLDTGNFDSCIGLLVEFRTNLPDSPLMPDMLYIAGNAHLAKQDYLRASNTYSEILKNYPDSPAAKEANMKSGVCLYNLELVNGAIQQLELYIATNPRGENIRDALYYLGYAYMKINSPLSSANAFKRLTIRYPNHPELLDLNFLMGKMFFDTGNYIEAENAFENFVYNTDMADTNNEDARYYLERIMYQTGRYGNETDIAEHFIAKYPESKRAPTLLFDLARYYRAKKMIESAVERYSVLLNNPLYSDNADSAAVMIADTYYDNGMTEQAHLFLVQTAEASSDTLRIQLMYLKLGELNELEERRDEAIAWYDRVLILDTSTDIAIMALNGIGRTFRSMSRWLEAAKTYERIIKEYPERGATSSTWLTLSEIYFLQGSTYQAADAADYAAALADSSDKWNLLIHAAEMFENIDENRAFTIYEGMFDNVESPPHIRTKALMRYGDLSTRHGNIDDALNAFDRVIADAADSIAVSEALQKVDDMRVSTPSDSMNVKND